MGGGVWAGGGRGGGGVARSAGGGVGEGEVAGGEQLSGAQGHADGRREACSRAGGAWEGAIWSADRARAWRLQADGSQGGELSLDEARAIAARLGVDPGAAPSAAAGPPPAGAGGPPPLGTAGDLAGGGAAGAWLPAPGGRRAGPGAGRAGGRRRGRGRAAGRAARVRRRPAAGIA